MKKSLLALAVLGTFAAAAAAQSSVTIYGSIDESIAKANTGTAPNNGAPANDAWTMQMSHQSRLGFKGNEDLGGGLSAQFVFEHRFNPDTGTTVGVQWNARSFVQLSSTAAGSIALGRDYSPVFWPAVKSDPFGWDGVGQIGGMQYAGFGDNSGVRISNLVDYKSPNFSGFTAEVGVGLGENAIAREDSFNVQYAAGPIYAALGYGKLKGGPNPAVDGNSLVNLAVHYDLGMVKPMFYYGRSKTNAGANTNKVWMIGATAPVGPGKIKAAYARVDPEGANNNNSKLGLGYEYFLSKRTDIYFDVGLARADNLTNNNAYALGVRHDF